MNITDHIERHALSRRDICQSAGISPALLSLIEAGERQITPKRVGSLAKALGVSPAQLRPDLAEVFGPVSDKPNEAA